MEDVRELMTTNPVVVSPDTSVADCARLLLEHRIRHLPVIDADRVLGVVTDFGVFRHGGMVRSPNETYVLFDADTSGTEARDLLLDVEVMVGPDDGLALTLVRLAATRQDIALVVESEQLVGLLTEHDGVRLAADILPLNLGVDHQVSAPVLVVRPEASGREALQQMIDNRVRHLVLADEDHLVCGVVSYRDLVSDDVRSHPEWTVLDAVRGSGVHSLPSTASLRQAARKMAEHKIGCLPILHEGQALVGVITRTDILEATAAILDEEAAFRR